MSTEHPFAAALEEMRLRDEWRAMQRAKDEIQSIHGTDAMLTDEYMTCGCGCESSLSVTFLPNGFNSWQEPALWLQIGRPGKKHRDVLLVGDDLRTFHAKLSEMMNESPGDS